MMVTKMAMALDTTIEPLPGIFFFRSLCVTLAVAHRVSACPLLLPRCRCLPPRGVVAQPRAGGGGKGSAREGDSAHGSGSTRTSSLSSLNRYRPREAYSNELTRWPRALYRNMFRRNKGI